MLLLLAISLNWPFTEPADRDLIPGLTAGAGLKFRNVSWLEK
jgi:hypothetical protein